MMASSQVRVAARRSVVDAQAERRRQRQEREDAIAALAIVIGFIGAALGGVWILLSIWRSGRRR